MDRSTRLRNQSTKEHPPCIWMQAGVVRRKGCPINYHCPSCRFDTAMRNIADENNRLKQAGRVIIGNRGRIMSWKQKLMAQPISKRPCIHHMKGRIEFKTCTHEYRCGNCDFDQYFHDQYSVHAVISPVDFLEIKGFKVPQGYYLHRGHTWVKVEEGSSVRVGIDEFALRVLGPFDSIEAPLLGKEVNQERADIGVFRRAHQAKILSPVSGVVTAINPRIREQGRLANQDPYSEGWVMNVHADSLRKDMKNLMINTQSRDFMEGQIERLYQIVEEIGGPLSTDGGLLGDDIYGKMPELGWEKLTRVFLNT